jgi:pilus assembly protein CpaC
VSTTVDLREGQWLALAGLIQDEQQGSRGRIPYIGDIPLVGGLFGSQSKKRDETELVVLVSTELIHPLEKEQVPLILPGMDVNEPTDAAFFFLQQYEGLPSAQHRSTRYSTWKQHVFLESWKGSHASRKSGHGFMAEQSFYVKGPSGLSE